VATVGVVLVPALAVSFIETAGRPWLVLSSVLLAMVLSVTAAAVGSALWTRRPKSTDLVFGDLMLWGLLRRVLAERRLEQAQERLRPGAGARDARELSLEHRRRTLLRLAAMLEAKDAYTVGHSRRVARHAGRIAREMGLSREDVAEVRIAASLHDIGKVRTPRQILTKSGSLTAEELTVMQRHPVDGARMVAEMGDPEITAMVRYHHERLDGTGYPEGLRGDDTPLGARIISVADTFDAITANRVYQGARKHRRALEVVSEEAGARLDPDAVAAFLRYYSGRREVAWSAFGLTGTPRLASWISGLGGGAVGWASPLAQGFAAIVAATLAGAALGGQPAPAVATATGRQAPPVASGSASDGAARADFAPAAGRRTEAAPRSRMAPIVERPGNGATPEVPSDDTPRGPGSGSGDGTGGETPVDTSPIPSVQVPSEAEPAPEPPTIAPPELRVPQVEVPHLEMPTIEAPTLGVPLSQVAPGVHDLTVTLPELQIHPGTPR
jgi:putative nucleotidyltransferase with HDIG domain